MKKLLDYSQYNENLEDDSIDSDFEKDDENFEHENEITEVYDAIEKTPEYVEFRKHHTKEIREFFKDQPFTMTPMLTSTLIVDVLTLVYKAGFKITKD